MKHLKVRSTAIRPKKKDLLQGNKLNIIDKLQLTLKIIPLLGGVSKDIAWQASRKCLSRNIGVKSLF